MSRYEITYYMQTVFKNYYWENVLTKDREIKRTPGNPRRYCARKKNRNDSHFKYFLVKSTCWILVFAIFLAFACTCGRLSRHCSRYYASKMKYCTSFAPRSWRWFLGKKTLNICRGKTSSRSLRLNYADIFILFHFFITYSTCNLSCKAHKLVIH